MMEIFEKSFIELRFHPQEKVRLSPPDKSLNHPSIYPCYYESSYLPASKSDPNQDSYHFERYYLYYPENLAIGLCHTFFPTASLLGYHKGDVEYVAILTRGDTKKVFFSAHSHEGKWYDISECELYKNRLVVYVALNSHACYPKAKRYWRLCGLANDVTSSKGKRLIPLVHENIYFNKQVPNYF